MSDTDFIEDLKDCVDDALQVRDEIGAIKAHVSIVTRTWTGDRVGNGTASDVTAVVYPTPLVVDLSHNIRLVEGGHVKQGDLLVKGISRDRYELSDIDENTGSRSIERFYDVDGKLYRIITVVKKYATWDVQIRRTSDQRRY